MYVVNSINSRAALDYTGARSEEILYNLIKEPLNQEYVRTLNAYIFQDMKKLGITYEAGKFREASKLDDELNISRRDLSKITIYSMRSYMNDKALNEFNKTLNGIDCNQLSNLSTKDFIKEISSIYARLDYIHPFIDGNSRTFRALTCQIANTAGFNLDWDKIANSQKLREDLYCARCKEVNLLALRDQPKHTEIINNILEMLDDDYPKKDLSSLLSSQKIVIPNFALDFKIAVQTSFDKIMTKEDVNYLPALISENMKMLSFKYPKIAAFSQIEKFVNTPIEKNSPISKIDNLVNIILPASYKMFEQNIKKFEPETLRNTISIVAKNYVAAQSKSLNINKKDRDR